MIIREACSKDINHILTLTDMVADIHGKNRPDIFLEHPYHITRKKLEHNIMSDRHHTIVADENEKIIGIMLCSIRSCVDDNKYRDTKIMSIEDTCVALPFRRRQIGTMLLNYVKELARTEGCSRLESNVWAFNNDSLFFFKANEFNVQRMIMECSLDDE